MAGPFLSEVGFEVLYWRPFLAWVCERFGIGPERVLVATRGGAGSWYDGIADAAIDVFEQREPSDLRGLQAERLGSRYRSQKQLGMTSGEQRLLEDLLRPRGMGLDDVAVLHPSAMYLWFKGFWDGWRSVSDVRKATLNRPITGFADAPAGFDLPADYVAAKVYFSDCFPDTPANREMASATLARLAGARPLVLLSTGLRVDDHSELTPSPAGEWMELPDGLDPVDNLRVQSAVIARARAFVGTYGGFSYLAPFLGVPSFSFYSEQNFIEEHLDVMRRAVPDLRAHAARACFVAQHTSEMQLACGLLDPTRRNP